MSTILYDRLAAITNFVVACASFAMTPMLVAAAVAAKACKELRISGHQEWTSNDKVADCVHTPESWIKKCSFSVQSLDLL